MAGIPISKAKASIPPTKPSFAIKNVMAAVAIKKSMNPNMLFNLLSINNFRN